MINYTNGSATDAQLVHKTDGLTQIDLSDMLGDVNFLEGEHRLDLAELIALHNIISDGLLDMEISNMKNKIIAGQYEFRKETKLVKSSLN